MEAIRHLNDCAVRSLQQSNSIECKTFLNDALERLRNVPVQQPQDRPSASERSIQDLGGRHDDTHATNNILPATTANNTNHQHLDTSLVSSVESAIMGPLQTQTSSNPAEVIMPTNYQQQQQQQQQQHQQDTRQNSITRLNRASYIVERVTFRSIPGSFDELDEIHEPEAEFFGDGFDEEEELSSGSSRRRRCLEGEAFPLYSRPFVFDFAVPFDFRWVGSRLASNNTSMIAGGEGGRTEPWTILPSQRTLCYAACLYNMALAHTLEYRHYKEGRASSSGSNTATTTTAAPRTTFRESGDYLLERALVLYEIAYHVLVQMSHVPSGDTAMILVMAVCNNIASVHHSLGNLEASRQWKQQLSFALYLSDLSNLDDQDSLGFFYFTAHLLPEFRAARAA
ncbi:hypothetical protein ACA910_017830 [Epithemia clementina (nom. ined.)]